MTGQTCANLKRVKFSLIPILFLFVLTFHVNYHYAQTAVVTIEYSGWTNECCSQNSTEYFCLNNGQSGACGISSTAHSQSFFDPIPPGNIITDITINTFSSGCGSDTISIQINSIDFPLATDLNNGCICDSNLWNDAITVSQSFSCDSIDYNYNGANTFYLSVTNGSAFCVDKTMIYFSYIPSGQGIPPEQPDSILGNSSPCAGIQQTYLINSVQEATSYNWIFPSGWTIISGQGDTSVSVIASDSSGLICVDGSNLCGTSQQRCFPVSVIIPFVPAIASAGPFCLNDSTAILYSDTNGGIWAGNGIIDSLSGDFSPASAGIGTHTISYSLFSGECSSSDTINIVVNDIPDNSVNTVGPSIFCEGDSAIIFAKPAAEYMWSDGDTVQWISVITTGDYSLTLTDSNGCSSVSSPVSITVNLLPDATITPNGDITLCKGDSVMLTASAANSYFWSNGETTQNIIAFNAGIFYVTVTDSNSCSAVDSAIITESTEIILSISTTPDSGNASGTASVTPGGGTSPYSYYWSNGDTTSSVSGLSSFVYFVTVTDAKGCTTVDSVFVDFYVGIPIQISSASGSQISIIPNPNKGEFELSVTGNLYPVISINVYNVLGELIHQKPTTVYHSSVTIDIQNQGSGIYYVRAVSEIGVMTKKIIVE